MNVSARSWLCSRRCMKNNMKAYASSVALNSFSTSGSVPSQAPSLSSVPGRQRNMTSGEIASTITAVVALITAITALIRQVQADLSTKKAAAASTATSTAATEATSGGTKVQ